MDAIVSAVLTDAFFTRPDDFEIQTPLFHPRKTEEDLKDGSIVIRFKAAGKSKAMAACFASFKNKSVASQKAIIHRHDPRTVSLARGCNEKRVQYDRQQRAESGLDLLSAFALHSF